MREDFPVKIERQRKELYPVAKAAREAGKKAVQVGEKLFIDGQKYTVHDLDKLPSDVRIRETAERETDTFYLFGGRLSVFSNFHRSHFILNDKSFFCNEQYYGWRKCLFAKDERAAQEILRSDDPTEIKQTADQVRVDYKAWITGDAKQVMIAGLTAKFSQNQKLKEALLATGTKTMVECSMYDKQWSIGLAMSDPRAEDCTTWQGNNLLGVCLDEVKRNLR